MLVFALFWDRFWKPFCFVLGSTLGALGGQKVINMASKNVAKNNIEKSRFRGGPSTKEIPGLVARRG